MLALAILLIIFIRLSRRKWPIERLYSKDISLFLFFFSMLLSSQETMRVMILMILETPQCLVLVLELLLHAVSKSEPAKCT